MRTLTLFKIRALIMYVTFDGHVTYISEAVCIWHFEHKFPNINSFPCLNMQTLVQNHFKLHLSIVGFRAVGGDYVCNILTVNVTYHETLNNMTKLHFKVYVKDQKCYESLQPCILMRKEPICHLQVKYFDRMVSLNMPWQKCNTFLVKKGRIFSTKSVPEKKVFVLEASNYLCYLPRDNSWYNTHLLNIWQVKSPWKHHVTCLTW